MRIHNSEVPNSLARHFFVLVLICCSGMALSPADAPAQHTSPDRLWRSVPTTEAKAARLAWDAALVDDVSQSALPKRYRLFDLDREVLEQLAADAPNEMAARAAADKSKLPRITIPMPDGTFRRFDLIESPATSKVLASKFPQLRSFRGNCVDNPLIRMRIDVAPDGMHAQVLGPDGTVLVNPFTEAGDNRYMSFNKRASRVRARPFQCQVEGRGAPLGAAARTAGISSVRSGDRLRTYRLAVACSGEYTQKFGGTKLGAMAAIVATINRVNDIYEHEFSIRLVLVDENDKLIFLDPFTDGFTNGVPGKMIEESQVTIDRVIGDANYDIGHTFGTSTRGGNGYAPGPVGVTGQKAKGVTTHDRLTGDPFNIDFVAHEMGHQFNGGHTFNGSGCNPAARSGETAVEPGSGSTILAYAGICNSDDLQQNSHAYFHAASLSQIVRYSRGRGNVTTPTPTGNTIPTVSAGSNSTIPKLTPFKLAARGTDADVRDRLTYCWEQIDIGPPAGLSAPDDGRIPLFRSFPPKPSPVRVFPDWLDVLSGSQTSGEQLPSKSRTMNFRVTVRDNQSGGGGVSSDDVAIVVDGSSGPFRVIEPAGPSVSSRLVEVAWEVAGTDQSPVGCQSVNILLSTDGGDSFSETLAAATANDGQQLVALPSTATSNLRILVESDDNIFFAVSPQNFVIEAAKADIFLVRHAEKEDGSNPDLTRAGRERAAKLAELMTGVGVSKVLSTDTRRTKQTAEPTAAAIGTSTEVYTDPSDLVSTLKQLANGQRALVVGHSNTVGPIINELGVASAVNIGDDYDNIFCVILTDGDPRFLSFKYAVDSPVIRVGDDRAAPPAALSATSPGAARAAPTQPTADASRQDPSPPVWRQSRATRLSSRVARTDSNSRADRFARSDLPVVYLEQNWSPGESLEFYRLRQGSPIMRKVFFDALEQPDSTGFFRDADYLSSFGFLPQRIHAGNPRGYPIGFSGNEAIEIACAACHTSRLTFNGKEYRIDGSQAMTDIESWLNDLVRAIKMTLADAPDVQDSDPQARFPLDQGTKFGRFAARVLESSTPRVAQIRIVESLLRRDYERRQRYNDYNDFGKRFSADANRALATKHEPYGFGRLDALGAILNQASAEMLGLDENARRADAPVNYPAIWDAPQHTHVQWNGAVDNTARFGPLGRNAGQVIGVFGFVDVESEFFAYDSSINFDQIKRAEQLITKLWSPQWPNEFGIDKAKAAQGEQVYRKNCIDCHALIDRDNPNRRANDVLVPIDGPFDEHGKLGTDRMTAKNWIDRSAKIGPLAGRYIMFPYRDEFPDDPNEQVPARVILTHVVFRSIVRSFVPWRDELTLDDAPQRAMMLARAGTNNPLMRYKARPLNGVWSTAPYLHNGSVPDMVELLKKPGDRKTSFRVGTIEFDPATLGYKDAGPFEFDTTKPGNSNSGHAYGTDTLSDGDKAALLEFLKTL